MVAGFDSFRKWFEGYENEYVIIGGTACLLYVEEAGLDFRATKDVDMVLIVEAVTPEFGQRFWGYVKDAEYQHTNKSTGEPQFYRFSNPKSKDYPVMIELFSRRIESLQIDEESRLTPLPLDENISSLSAILLNEAYYEFLKKGRMVIDGIPILAPSYIIPFKAKAWLDLSERRKRGEHVDSKNIKKHKNDVFRMAIFLTEEEKVELNEEIRKDMEEFLNAIKNEKMDLKSIGIRGIGDNELMELLERTYL